MNYKFLVKENERIDDLEYENLKIIQNSEWFCFGIDSVLLSDFAKKYIKWACYTSDYRNNRKKYRNFCRKFNNNWGKVVVGFEFCGIISIWIFKTRR